MPKAVIGMAADQPTVSDQVCLPLHVAIYRVGSHRRRDRLTACQNYCPFGTHRSGQKGAIILADLFGHQVVEQGIHPQDRVFIFVALQSEVVQLVGILGSHRAIRSVSSDFAS